MKKSWIGTDVITFFGCKVRPGSWGSSDSRKQSTNAMLFPETQKQMQSFLGESYPKLHCSAVLEDYIVLSF